MDLVIVNPNNRIGGEFPAIEPPWLCGLFATHYRQGGFSVKIVDAEAENLTVDETADRVVSPDPQQVLIVVAGQTPSNTSTPKMAVATELRLKINGDVKFTGIHPQATLKYGVISAERLMHFPPSIAWDLLPMDKYRAHNWHCMGGIPRQPYGVIYTSLGCPFSCSYCNIHALYGGKRKIAFRPIKDIIGEIDILVNNYKVKNIKIVDEMFGLHERRVVDICDAIIERSYDLNMWAYARVDTVTDKMLKKMKKAGINWVCYGFESANLGVRGDVAKKFEQAVMERAVRMTRNAGINIIANFIFGLPEDNLETMRDTLDWAKKHLFEYVNFYVAMAYPGSQLYDDAVKQGTPLPKKWSGYGQYAPDCLPLPTKYLTPKQVLKFRDNAFIEYFSNPKYLEMVERKFGDVAQIKEMLKWKLKRNILK